MSAVERKKKNKRKKKKQKNKGKKEKDQGEILGTISFHLKEFWMFKGIV